MPIGQIVAKPPQARDREKIAALMTEVEKQRNSKAKAVRKAEGSKAPAGRSLMGSYIPGAPDVAADFAGPWIENHGLLLPADFRIFLPLALTLIEAGKFERGLARRLPAVLPKGATVLEIGSAVGFLGLHLAKIRPDLRVVMAEDNPSLDMTMQRIMARNGLKFGERLALRHTALGDGLIGLATEVRPQVLFLADPGLTPDTLLGLLPRLHSPLPERILLYGRLLENHHTALGPVEDLLAGMGYIPGLSFDRGLAWSFVLPPA